MAISINEEIISDENIEQEFRRVKSEYERQLQVACCERDAEFLQMAKDHLISRILLNQAAKSKFPEVSSEEIENRLKRLYSEAGGMEAFYQQMGVNIPSPEELQSTVANGVRVDKTLQEVYGEEAAPTQEEKLTYYEEHKDLFKTDPLVRATHISISPHAHLARWQVYELMCKLRHEILQGADIEALALEHNTQKEFPPDLGWFRRGEFMEEFETLAFSMNEGELSPVFLTQLGYHLFKVTGLLPAELLPFEKVEEEITMRVHEKKRDLKFQVYLESLKAEALIHDDLNDLI